MTSSNDNNRCKLLILDIDINQISIDNLRTYFTFYGPIEWIETFPKSSSAIIYFVSYLSVDRLVNDRTCTIGEINLRLRRFRYDQTNWHIDSHTLHVKLNSTLYSTYVLNETSLRYCFQDYQSYINKIDINNDNQALISFSNYDYVDQILLMPSNRYMINGESIILERIIQKLNKKSRWDQPPIPLTTIPTLSARDPIVHKLITHIEYLTKQIREQPNHSRNEIERLEAEVFILKNENANLKLKQELSLNKNIEKRLTVLEDISNRIVKKKYHENRRERSYSNNHEKQIKRRRKYKINDDYSDSP
jgi:hypothetical protein